MKKNITFSRRIKVNNLAGISETKEMKDRLEIGKKQFTKLVSDITEILFPEEKYSFSLGGISVLYVACEDFSVGLFEDHFLNFHSFKFISKKNYFILFFS